MNGTLPKTVETMRILLLMLMLSCQNGIVVDVTRDENVEKVIASEFKRLQLPGLAYAAVKNDSVVYCGAQGYANIKEKKALTPQTRMLVASISKTMIVTAVMQLYEKGLVSLDKDIGAYLPFKVQNPNFPDDTLTVKMVLTHTSSISDAGYLYSLFYLHGYVDYPESIMSFERNYLTREGLYYSKDSYSGSKPGSVSVYSNVGATLLACLVEQVSGIDFNTYCKKNIFEPLGMTKTTWLFSETPKTEVAIPYGDNYIVDPSNPFYSYPDYPDGQLITTVDDLSRFLRAFVMNGTFNNHQLLTPETVDMILREEADCGNDCNQGLIFEKIKIGNTYVWGHSGGDDGISTEMYFDRIKKTGYLMFNNRSGAYSETIGNALLLYAENR